MSVCLYVCMSVSLSARISRTRRVQTSRNLLYMLIVAVARSCSDDNAIRLWMTSCLPIIVQGRATLMDRILKVKVTHQGAAPGRSHNIYDRLVCGTGTSLDAVCVKWNVGQFLGDR